MIRGLTSCPPPSSGDRSIRHPGDASHAETACGDLRGSGTARPAARRRRQPPQAGGRAEPTAAGAGGDPLPVTAQTYRSGGAGHIFTVQTGWSGCIVYSPLRHTG